MEQQLDQEAQEQERQQAKAIANVETSIYSVLFLMSGFALIATVACCFFAIASDKSAVGVLLFGIVLLGIINRYCWYYILETRRRAGKTTFVPPVDPNTLPAVEILVRAAEEPPTAQCDVLLRAAQGQETPQEELLRVSQE